MTTENNSHFDLIIIGTGSGNSIPGPEFDDKSIAIVERGKFGGTCLNVGCIPTKMFVYAAHVAETIRTSKKYGIEASIDSIDWPGIVHRVFDERVDPISRSGEEYRRGDQTPNIEVFDQSARFVGPRTIATGQGSHPRTITGDTIVIAAGARPYIPSVIKDSGVRYYTNEDIMRIPSLPSSMIIMGGGSVAMEFASIFHAFGVRVSIINRSTRLLKKLDDSISEAFTEITEKTLDCHLGRTVTSACTTEAGVEVTLDSGEKVAGELLLVATGRTPNGDQLDLETAGIEMSGSKIAVDSYGRTTAPGVWALGDISSPYELKHVANAEMRTVRHNILHPDDLRTLPHKNVPAGVFTHPQIATVGYSEQEAQERSIPICTHIQMYGTTAYGWALEDTTSFIKLIANRETGKLIGAHIMGPEATTLIQQLITVMSFNLDLNAVATQEYWIHPALPEVIENGLLELIKKLKENPLIPQDS